MTLSEAAQAGINRLRRPMWETAYAKIDISDGMMGPWLHLYDRGVQNAIGEPTPQSKICIGDDTSDYEPYTGEIDPNDTPN